MTTSIQAPTTVSNLAVAMFTVSDQDAALAFYTDKLGWEVRGDDRFGENLEMRWLEVAPPGSAARLALNPPMCDEPGESAGDAAPGGARSERQPSGGSIGVESSDVRAEHQRLSAIDGVTISTPPMEINGAPLMFSIADPYGNQIWIVETPRAS